jgi:hypothetical protein
VVIQGQADSNFTFFIQSPDRRHGILEIPTPGDNNAWMSTTFESPAKDQLAYICPSPDLAAQYSQLRTQCETSTCARC